jgi:chemotaxis signal transduction protein
MSANQGVFDAPTVPSTAPPRIAFRPHPAIPWLVLPQSIPLQVLIDASAVDVPNTCAWFRGVVSQRGNLIPVFDLAEWAELTPDNSPNVQIVAIGLGARACALRCSESPTLLNVTEHAVEAPIDGPLAPYLSQPYTSALGKAYEFDIQRWLTHAATQVAAVGR